MLSCSIILASALLSLVASQSSVCPCTGWSACIQRRNAADTATYRACEQRCLQASNGNQQVACAKRALPDEVTLMSQWETCYTRQMGSPDGCSNNGQLGASYTSQLSTMTNTMDYGDYGQAINWWTDLEGVLQGTGLVEYGNCVDACDGQVGMDDSMMNDVSPSVAACAQELRCTPANVNLTASFAADEVCERQMSASTNELTWLDALCRCAAKTAECVSIRTQLQQYMASSGNARAARHSFRGGNRRRR